MTFLEIMGSKTKELTFFIFPKTKFTIRYKNFIIIPDSTCFNFQIHITRQHVNIFSDAIIDLTRCITKSVLISFDIVLNIYSAIYNVLKIIKKG